ncbi:hypothetical protein EGI22_12715 [Lacihabitans sp. LS3-19]|nr:hypothetical protein [Lacihabitans sp. LS3-19]
MQVCGDSNLGFKEIIFKEINSVDFSFKFVVIILYLVWKINLKYKNWDEVPKNNLEFWLRKTPNERLLAAKELNRLAKDLFSSNPNKKIENNGRRISKFRSIAECET